MPLPDLLQKRWAQAASAAAINLTMDETGVSLGKTVLARFAHGRLAFDHGRVAALLSVAYSMNVPKKVMDAFHNAERCWKHGDKALANMHLALTGLHAVDLEKAQRLFAAHWAMENGVTAEQLYTFAGILHKDDEDDEDDDDEDGGSSDGFGFDPAAHPRWPAGSPGGIGGEFAPKDTGDATQTLHDAISQSANIAINITTNAGNATAQTKPYVPPDEGRVDESYGLDAAIGIVGAIGIEALSLLGEGRAATSSEVTTGAVTQGGGAAGADATTGAVTQQTTVQDLLMPGGRRLGQTGSSGAIREVTGNAQDAQTFFNQLTQGGQVIQDSTYNGIRMSLPNGGTASIRTFSTASPGTAATIDVNIPNVPIDKIKFNP